MKRRQYVISQSTQKVKVIVFEDNSVLDDMICPVETKGPIIASLALQPAHGGRPHIACTINPREEDGHNEDMGGNDRPLDNPPPKGKGGSGAPPGGGGKAGTALTKKLGRVIVKMKTRKRTPKSLGRKTM